MNETSRPPNSDTVTPQMLEALRNGDHQVFNRIYIHHFNYVVKFLNALLHNDEDAKEIAQLVFMNIWENRGKIDPSKNIKGYIYTYAKFNALDLLSHRKVQDKYTASCKNKPPDFENAPDDIVISRETELLIKVGLECMPAQRRKIFEMSRFQGLKDDEIAKIMHLSKRTVQNHIYTAVKDLRELIAYCMILFIP